MSSRRWPAEFCIVVFAEVDVSADRWSRVSVWSNRGFELVGSLCFADVGAEAFNTAFWQRVYVARDAKQLRIGFAVGWSWSLS